MLTIIVLLILAAVAINLTIGDNGIISRADQAKEAYIVSEEKEAISIAWQGCKIDKPSSKVESTDLENELKNNGKNTTVDDLDECLQVTFSETFHSYFVYQNDGRIEDAIEIKTATFSNSLSSLIQTIVGDKKNVRAIVKGEKPDINSLTDSNIVSTADSEVPIYMWFVKDNDSELGTLYWWSEARKTKIINCDRLFSDFTNLSDISGLKNWDTSEVTSMVRLFYKTSISDLTPLRDWNTEKVKSLGDIFGYTDITNADGLENWKTSNVTDLEGIFENDDIENVDGMANWDTSNVKTMRLMFLYGSIANTDGFAKWNTESVTDMESMFNSAGIGDLSGLSNWNTHNLDSMGAMFYRSGVENVDFMKNWDLSNLTDMSQAFAGCSYLQNLNGMQNLKTPKLQTLNCTFWCCSSITNLEGLNNWDVSNVTDFHGTFYQMTKLTDISALSNWNTSSGKDVSYMFWGSPITNPKSIDKWNINSVTNFHQMFRNGGPYPDFENRKGTWDQYGSFTPSESNS